MVKMKKRKNEHLNNTFVEEPEISEEEDLSDDLSDDDMKDILLIGYTRDKFLKMIDDELDELGF